MSEELVYHYTTAEGLLGILQGSAFWATRIDYLNDKGEYLIGMEMLSDSVDQQMFNNRKGFMATPDEALEHNIERLKAKKALFFVKEVLQGQPKELDLFSVSFTTERDSVKHWMAYTKANNAYCIGLSRKHLYRHFNDSHNTFRNVSYPLSKDKSIPLFRAGLILGDAVIWGSSLDSLFVPRKYHYSLREKIQARKTYLQVLSKVNMYACFAKDASFAHELEARLVSVNITDVIDKSERFIGARDYPKQIKSSDVFYRPVSGMLVPTKSVYVPKEAIKEVIVGPHYSSDLASRSVTELANKLGYTIKVDNSKVPLRYL